MITIFLAISKILKHGNSSFDSIWLIGRELVIIFKLLVIKPCIPKSLYLNL